MLPLVRTSTLLSARTSRSVGFSGSCWRTIGGIRAVSATSSPASGGGSAGGNGASAGRKSWGSGGDGGGRRRAGWGLLSLLAQGVLTGAALAAPKQPENKLDDVFFKKDLTVENVTDTLWALAGPILTNLGFSGVVGFAAGFALKKIGQAVAFLVGTAFMLLQGLAYAGYIEVKWTNVHAQVVKTLDANNDGKLDAQDFKVYVNSGLGILSQGVPSAGGFLAGFLLAIKTC